MHVSKILIFQRKLWHRNKYASWQRNKQLDNDSTNFVIKKNSTKKKKIYVRMVPNMLAFIIPEINTQPRKVKQQSQGMK